MKSTAKLLQQNVKSRHYLKKSVLFSKKTLLLFLTSKDTTFFALVQKNERYGQFCGVRYGWVTHGGTKKMNQEVALARIGGRFEKYEILKKCTFLR